MEGEKKTVQDFLLADPIIGLLNSTEANVKIQKFLVCQKTSSKGLCNFSTAFTCFQSRPRATVEEGPESKEVVVWQSEEGCQVNAVFNACHFLIEVI